MEPNKIRDELQAILEIGLAELSRPSDAMAADIALAEVCERLRKLLVAVAAEPSPLFDIARRANVLSHLVGRYFGGTLDYVAFHDKAYPETKALRRALNDAGFGIDERGEPFEPEE